jgi:hypothetical protein
MKLILFWFFQKLDILGIKMKKLVIVTPCSRIKNIKTVFKSIDFKKNVQWIIVYDSKQSIQKFSNNKIKEFSFFNHKSKHGNAQRNYAINYLKKLKNKNFFIYFLDDDNILHKDFQNYIENLHLNKLYTFDQDKMSKGHTNGKFHFIKIFKGDNPLPGKIDTAQFLSDFKLIKNIKFKTLINGDDCDGRYIQKCISLNINKYQYIPKVLCHYNYLNRKNIISLIMKLKNFINFRS